MEPSPEVYAGLLFEQATSFAEKPAQAELQKAMLDATPDCIKVLSLDGRLLTMNKAGCLALGVAEDSDFGMEWLPLLPPDVHKAGREALQQAYRGTSARFPGKSISADGVLAFWDNLLTPVVAADGRVLSVLCVSRDISTQTKLEWELQAAIERETLLTQEMQHRVKNLFAVTSSLIALSESEAKKLGTPDLATSLLRDKIGALSRACDAVFPSSQQNIGSDGCFELTRVVDAVLKPYREKCSATGPILRISEHIFTTIALFMHELATNAVKHGALSTDLGNVTIEWETEGTDLVLTWSERGGPPIAQMPHRQGFGTKMIERLITSLGGAVNWHWPESGMILRLRLRKASA